MNRTTRARMLLALLGVFVVAEVLLWRATHGFPAMLDQSETTIKFLAGRNFDRFGVFTQWLTPDFATGSAEAAHPMYYTHYADFTDHVAYLLIKAGVTTIPGQILVGIGVTGLGLYVMFLAVEAYVSYEIALWVLLASVVDYASVLVAALNTHKDWAWLVVFAPLLAWKRYADTRRAMFFWLALASLFLLGYYDYGLLVYVALVVVCLKAFSFFPNVSWPRTLCFLFLGGVSSFAVHELLVVGALGLQTFITDARVTYLNRVAGTLSRHDMIDFYQKNGIVLWGYDEPGTLVKNAGVTWARILQIVGLPTWIVVGMFAICLLMLVARRRPNTMMGLVDESALVKARFIVSLMAPLLVMFPVFHIQMTVLYGSAWAPLYIFPVSIVLGIALWTVFSTTRALARQHAAVGPWAMSLAWAIFVPALILWTQIGHLFGDLPLKEFPGHDVLGKYKGHSFVTNYQGAYVSYFTHEWAIYHGMTGITAGHFPEVDAHSRSYIFERDVLKNRTKYDHPEFAFLLWTDNAAVSGNFTLLDKGDNFWIYDLRSSK